MIPKDPRFGGAELQGQGVPRGPEARSCPWSGALDPGSGSKQVLCSPGQDTHTFPPGSPL